MKRGSNKIDRFYALAEKAGFNVEHGNAWNVGFLHFGKNVCILTFDKFASGDYLAIMGKLTKLDKSKLEAISEQIGFRFSCD